MNFAEILKELRDERNLTQAEVAKKCNVSCQCISSLEMGSRNPTGSTLKALADFFNVSADYLLGRTEEYGGIVGAVSSQLTDEEEELLLLFRKLPTEYRSHELESLRMFAGEPMKTALPKKA